MFCPMSMVAVLYWAQLQTRLRSRLNGTVLKVFKTLQLSFSQGEQWISRHGTQII